MVCFLGMKKYWGGFDDVGFHNITLRNLHIPSRAKRKHNYWMDSQSMTRFRDYRKKDFPNVNDRRISEVLVPIRCILGMLQAFPFSQFCHNIALPTPYISAIHILINRFMKPKRRPWWGQTHHRIVIKTYPFNYVLLREAAQIFVNKTATISSNRPTWPCIFK